MAPPQHMTGEDEMSESELEHSGNQRLSIKRLSDWRALEYGMFIRFGMATFSPSPKWPDIHRPIPVEHYCPSELDVSQWVRTAKEAGMRYAVLSGRGISRAHLRKRPVSIECH